MKRLIYEPAVNEVIPNGRATVSYLQPVMDVVVIDVIVDDSFTTDGTVFYDSTIITPAVYDENGELVTPPVIAQELSEDFIHHFGGWGNI